MNLSRARCRQHIWLHRPLRCSRGRRLDSRASRLRQLACRRNGRRSRHLRVHSCGSGRSRRSARLRQQHDPNLDPSSRWSRGRHHGCRHDAATDRDANGLGQCCAADVLRMASVVDVAHQLQLQLQLGQAAAGQLLLGRLQQPLVLVDQALGDE